MRNRILAISLLGVSLVGWSAAPHDAPTFAAVAEATFDCTGATQHYTVPKTSVGWRISAWGASGRAQKEEFGGAGGFANFRVHKDKLDLAGKKLRIDVGCRGPERTDFAWAGGGGGATVVALDEGTDSTILLVAGGGGGAAYGTPGERGGDGGVVWLETNGKVTDGLGGTGSTVTGCRGGRGGKGGAGGAAFGQAKAGGSGMRGHGGNGSNNASSHGSNPGGWGGAPGGDGGTGTVMAMFPYRGGGGGGGGWGGGGGGESSKCEDHVSGLGASGGGGGSYSLHPENRAPQPNAHGPAGRVVITLEY